MEENGLRFKTDEEYKTHTAEVIKNQLFCDMENAKFKQQEEEEEKEKNEETEKPAEKKKGRRNTKKENGKK